MKLIILTAAIFAVAVPMSFAATAHHKAHHARRATHHAATAESCGGALRWRVKVASDPDARNIDTENVRDRTNTEHAIVAFNHITPSEGVSGKDNTTRMEMERTVYSISGYMAYYVQEADSDYHLAIWDGVDEYSEGGRDNDESGHSFVAEIPDPDCFAGGHGDLPDRSALSKAISESWDCFKTNIVDKGVPQKQDLGIRYPVTITGVVFFDRNEGQVGRSLLHHEPDGRPEVVTELHPVIRIDFAGASCRYSS